MGSKKILVVGDDGLVSSYLRSGGYETIAALDDQSSVDLVLINADAADCAGFENIRLDSCCPMVVIKSGPEAVRAADPLLSRAFDCLAHPVQRETLLKVCAMALKHGAVLAQNETYKTHLDAISNSVSDSIIAVDSDLKVLEINDAAKTICNLSADDLGVDIRKALHSCKCGCVEALEEAVAIRRRVARGRIECAPGSGRRRIISMTATPLARSGGAVMVVRDETRLDDLERSLKERKKFSGIVGKSRNMQKVYAMIENLVDVQSTVLITGESGTGKELVAEALHMGGIRSAGPLVKVNCSALSENLLESELFGHVKGAFTGALRDKSGRFEIADGGTIFLDEVGDIPIGMQVKLLRVLQEREFERVGDTTPVRVDVRVVAATNQDLREKVRSGIFREDLYYRLKVIEIHVPSLKDRMEDMPLLVEFFLNKFNGSLNKNVSGVSDEVMRLFMRYPWRGNVRELEHAIEHAMIVCRQNVISLADLPADLGESDALLSNGELSREAVSAESILHALEESGWKKAKAARQLGVSRSTLYRKIEELNLTDRINNRT